MGGVNLAESIKPNSDGYIRLVWLDQLLHGGGWYNHIIADINAPYGGSLHWTRLFDILIIVLALPLAIFLPMADAVYWSAMVICLLLLLASLYAMAWAVQPIVPKGR